MAEAEGVAKGQGVEGHGLKIDTAVAYETVPAVTPHVAQDGSTTVATPSTVAVVSDATAATPAAELTQAERIMIAMGTRARWREPA